MSRFLTVLVSVLFLVRCSASPEDSKRINGYQLDSYEKVPSKHYTMYLKRSSLKQNSRVKLIVVENKSQEIVYGPDQIKGYVSWYDEFQLKVKEKHNRMEKTKETSKYIYYIHLPTAKKSY